MQGVYTKPLVIKVSNMLVLVLYVGSQSIITAVKNYHYYNLVLKWLVLTGTTIESPSQPSPSGSGDGECECSDFVPPGISYSCAEQVMKKH